MALLTVPFMEKISLQFFCLLEFLHHELEIWIFIFKFFSDKSGLYSPVLPKVWVMKTGDILCDLFVFHSSGYEDGCYCM